MRRSLLSTATLALGLAARLAAAEELPAQWGVGSEDCAARPQPPLEVHAYTPTTLVLRESLCATAEGPFMYLLLGTRRALLIDTGDVADPVAMPLAKTVLALLPEGPSGRLPLTVVHSHGHLDHRTGDAQFARLDGVRVVPSDLKSVRDHFGLGDWPGGAAEVDLGDRVIDVLPAPGHHPSQIVYYDRTTGLLFTGDFLLPGRLLVDDSAAYASSAERVAAFVRERRVTHVLGGHDEKDREGNLEPWGSHFHPSEGPLQLAKSDVLALPPALHRFNGFYSHDGSFVLLDSIRILIVEGLGAAALVAGASVWLYRARRRRR
jgi:glyoxylase-like metal-dependent hydrolase (beta-lactamase superfamily II)